MKDEEYFAKAIELWGLASQFEMLQEECAELIVAVNHLKRDRISLTTVAEEIVDVEMMLAEIKTVIDKSDYENWKSIKWNKFKEQVDRAMKEI